MKTESSKGQTTSSLTRVRCINLDWLEVYALEPCDRPHDPDYFRGCGFIVHERGYGTRVYSQMFTLEGDDGLPLLEIRRKPMSSGETGILPPNASHIRLCNRTCYFNNAAGLLADFLDQHNYTDVRISRADVCLDFTKFDRNDDPAAFVRRYFRHVYAKINQGNIRAHGADTWSGQEWNSLSWGSLTSDVGTKMYDKTMELYDAKLDAYRKPYIRESWLRCHLIDDVHRCTMKGNTVRVWRVEFSIRSSVRKWFRIELDGRAGHYQSIRNTLDMYEGRDRLLVMFASLARHYFRFKYYEPDKRKDRCKDKVLFEFDGMQTTYTIDRTTTLTGTSDRHIKPLDRLIIKLRMYRDSHSEEELRAACNTIISYMQDESMRADLANPFDREELEALRHIMAIKCRRPDLHVNVVMQYVKQLMHINDNTATF